MGADGVPDGRCDVHDLGRGLRANDRDDWLATGDQASSIILEGGLDTIETEADRLAEAILSLV